MLLLGKSVLDADILSSIHPSLLSSCRNAFIDRATGSSAIIQVTYADDFSRLLRLGHRPAHRERDDDRNNPHQFSILDFRFSIVGQRIQESHPRSFNHVLVP